MPKALGWDGTQQAWKSLFPSITLVLCFLHTVLGIQKLCRRTSSVFQVVTDKLWHLYHSLNRRQFAQRLRRLMEWSQRTDNDLPEKAQQKLLTLPTKAAQFNVTFDLPQAYHTSNQVDRLMNYQDRILYGMQYFHGTLTAAKQGLRAMALLSIVRTVFREKEEGSRQKATSICKVQILRQTPKRDCSFIPKSGKATYGLDWFYKKKR